MRFADLRRVQEAAGAVFSTDEGVATAIAFGNLGDEYRAVRGGAALFDRCGRGRLLVSGEDRVSWLQGMVTNDVRPLAPGGPRVQACVLDATGHVIAEVALVALSDDTALVDLERSVLARVGDLFEQYIIVEDVEVADASSSLACLSLQGPRSSELVAVAVDATVAAADHTGSGGYDIYASPERAADLWLAMRDAGAVPAGERTAEAARIEAGIPRDGIDLDERVLPLEAGLEATHISFDKGCYVGQEIVARIRSHGHTNRGLVGLAVGGRRLPAHNDAIVSAGLAVGRVTSSAVSPALSAVIALGYVRHEHRVAGSTLLIRSADGDLPASVVALPFVSPGHSE